MAEICRLAAAHGIPVVFALTRIGLGSIFAANKRMSGEHSTAQHSTARHGTARHSTARVQRK